MLDFFFVKKKIFSFFLTLSTFLASYLELIKIREKNHAMCFVNFPKSSQSFERLGRRLRRCVTYLVNKPTCVRLYTNDNNRNALKCRVT